jgi:flagellar assembly protein FliH
MSSSDRGTQRRPPRRLRVLPAGQSGRAVRPALEGLELLARDPVPCAAAGASVPVPAMIDSELLGREFARGVEAGRAETRDMLGPEYEDKLSRERERVDGFLESLAGQIPPLAAGRERFIVGLAFAVAGRILKAAVQADPEVVIRQVQEAVRRVHGMERIIVRVHPDDTAIVRARRLEVTAGSDAARELAVEPDERVSRGGCLLESDSGTVDAQLMTQMHNLETALLDGPAQGEEPA